MLGPAKCRDLDRSILTSLEALIPADHFYRHLDATLDLSFVRAWVADLYAPVGRPSIDPVIFFKLELVLFLEGLRSERQLMRLAADRLSVRWYLGFGLDEPLPDHSSLTRIRERYGLETFRKFFDAIVEQCANAGLVWGKELFFDATKVQANASLDSVKPRFAVDQHLRNLFAEPDGESDGPADDRMEDEQAAGDAAPEELHRDLPPDLAEQNSSRHDWIAAEGRPERDVQRHAYRRVADFQMSITDPDATLMRARAGSPLQLGYHDHYVVDGGKARIILKVLVTASEVMENQPMLDLLWRTCFRWHIYPHQATGDTTYGTAENIVAIENAGIHAYVPLPDFDKRTPFYGQRDFTYDPDLDAYRCPQGELLRLHTRSFTDRTIQYRAEPAVCNACPLKARCTASSEGRMIGRSFDAAYLDRVREYHQGEPYQRAIRKRKVWVEPLFAEGKLWHGLRRFRLRRLWRVNSEALMIATAQNLKRLLTRRGWGRRPASGMAYPAPLWERASFESLLRFVLKWMRDQQGVPSVRSAAKSRLPHGGLFQHSLVFQGGYSRGRNRHWQPERTT